MLNGRVRVARAEKGATKEAAKDQDPGGRKEGSPREKESPPKEVIKEAVKEIEAKAREPSISIWRT